jgi:aldehyde:ferredoxin oxidoreductase
MPAKRQYGQVLMVDLSDRSSRPIELQPEILRRFIGGAGLAAYLYSQLVTRDIAPLDPASPFIIMTGPLTGTPVMLSRAAWSGRPFSLDRFWGEAR